MIVTPLPKVVHSPLPFYPGAHFRTLVYMSMILVVDVAPRALAVHLPFPSFQPLPDATNPRVMLGNTPKKKSWIIRKSRTKLDIP
jgi:hypothetical protein